MKYDPLVAPDPEAWLRSDDDDRVLVCAQFHRRFKGPHPKPENWEMHNQVHVIAENQLALGDPPQAREAMERLLRGGLDRHEALHAIARCLAEGIWQTLKEKKPFPAEEYARALDALTVESASEDDEDDELEEEDEDDLGPPPETIRRIGPRAGPNDRCPCGSGKKYKRCCQARDLAAASAEPEGGVERPLASVTRLPDPRSLERTLAQFGESALGTTSRPRGALAEAQELMYEAWEATEPVRRINLANKALAVCADCADAFVLLAQEEATTLAQARNLYAKGVAAGERALGPKILAEEAGHFWGLLETRPYMRARSGLAEVLLALGEREAGIGHLNELLRLNPKDNQGVRDVLIGALLAARDRDEEAERLLARYEGDAGCSGAYSAALLAFRKHGDAEVSRQKLAKAISANAHVPDYLLGTKRLPAATPNYFTYGDENEAVIYLSQSLEAWCETPGAEEWLADASPTLPKRRRKARK